MLPVQFADDMLALKLISPEIHGNFVAFSQERHDSRRYPRTLISRTALLGCAPREAAQNFIPQTPLGAVIGK